MTLPRSLSSSKRKRPQGAASALESQLASVIEQDGVVLLSARGQKMRPKRDATDPTFLSSPKPISSGSVTDEVAELDAQVVGLAVQTYGGRQIAVDVRHGEHDPSPYVISLQNVLLQPERRALDERVDLNAAARVLAESGSSLPPEVYASMSSDLTGGVDLPRLVRDQHTPATFEEAYRAVYGRFDSVSSVFREGFSVIAGWFQRVERVERASLEEAADEGILEFRRLTFARALAGFAALAFIVTLPANAVALYRSVSSERSAATSAGSDAVSSLETAAKGTDITTSADALKHASTRFRQADAALSNASTLAVGLASLMPQTYRSARALLEVGDKASEAGHLLAVGFDKVFSDPSRGLDERLGVLGAYARTSLTLLSDASKAAATVDTSKIPASSRDKVTALLSGLDDSTQAVREVTVLSDLLAAMAGRDHQRTYLVIFQNQTELRPTGGFMGSFAEVHVDRGHITAVRVPPGGTYALKGQSTVRVSSPAPMHLINADWQFQDANWSPDFPTAADQIRYFWSKAGQPTVDGIITVNASFVEKLLAVTGPIDLPDYGKTIDASNFMLETQKAVELDYDKTSNTPKKFIGDLGDKLMARMQSLSKDEWVKVAGLMSDALTTKDIQIALFDPSEEAIVERYGWNGRIKDAPGDSLAIIEANIAGQKTDGKVAEQVDHHANIHEDGSIDDTVTLARTHTGSKGDLFSGVRNVSYVRFYVPKGSVLTSASGFDKPDASLFKPVDPYADPDPAIAAVESKTVSKDGIDVSVDGSHTVFGGWVQLDPGMSQTITLSYTLPFNATDVLARSEDVPQDQSGNSRDAYLMLYTSQSGKSDRTLTSTVDIPSDWSVSWSRGATAMPTGLTLQGTWDRDLVLAALLTPPHGQETQTNTVGGP